MELVKPLEDLAAEVVTTVVAVDKTVPEPETVAGTEEFVVDTRPVEILAVPVVSTEELLLRGREPRLVEETRTSQ